jgi:hypothetical protein
VKDIETLSSFILVGWPLSYILTLHVEEKGVQRRTHSFYFPSPILMTGWRGKVEAEEEEKIVRLR